MCLAVLACCSARADYTVDFVRISCIKDARLLDVEYRGLHNPAVDATSELGDIKTDVWRRHGFFDPAKLSYACSLPESEYKIVASQGPWRESGMCGAAPEIIMSLFRNGEPLLDHVVFGPSCLGRSSAMRVTIEDGKEGWYSREAEVCVQRGLNEASRKCEWFSTDYDGFKRFPLRQADIEKLSE